MRNLKKILALVLALVMSLSLVTMANADYADQADIDNAEAVAVMSAIGVLQGSDGKFNPDAILSREEAAKIITYVLLGKEKADKLTTTIAPFADVAADRWSAGSIAYCADQGILDGIGGGKFDPTGKLTGLQFAKMVLCAMGYDAAIEGLTGETFAIKTATLAIDLGLDKDVSVDLAAQMSRENAAQMAFNALEKEMVKYEGGTTVELPGGTKVVVGAVQEEAGKQLIDLYEEKLEKIDAEDIEEPDAFGRPEAYAWSYDDEVIYTSAAKATKVYYGEVKANDVWKDLGKPSATKLATTTVLVNGETPDEAATIEKDAEGSFGGNNTIVEVYFDKDEAEATVIVIEYEVDTVETVTEAEVDKYGDVTAEAYITLTGGDTYETEAYAEGDVVLFALVDDEIEDMKKAESFTGKVSSVKGTKATIDGTAYTNVYGVGVGDEGTFYKGVCGAIVYAEGVDPTTSDDYALVYNVVDTTDDAGKNEDGYNNEDDTQYTAYVILADGTKASYVIDEDSYAAFAAPVEELDEEEEEDVLPEEGEYFLLVCYSINKDGKLEVVDADSTTASEAAEELTFGKSNAVVDGKYTNASTKFVFAKKADNKMGTKLVTGYKNVANQEASAWLVWDTESSKVLTVFVEDEADADEIVDKDIYILMDTEPTETLDADDETVYTYDVQVNGKAAALETKVEDVFGEAEAGFLFTVTLTDGMIEDDEDIEAVEVETGDVDAVLDEYVVIDGESFYFADDAEIYLVDAEDGYALSKTTLKAEDEVTFYAVDENEDSNYELVIVLVTARD